MVRDGFLLERVDGRYRIIVYDERKLGTILNLLKQRFLLGEISEIRLSWIVLDGEKYAKIEYV